MGKILNTAELTSGDLAGKDILDAAGHRGETSLLFLSRRAVSQHFDLCRASLEKAKELCG